MRVVNIITIMDGNTQNIESFGIFEEQLSNDVVEVAEKKFIEVARELGMNDMDDINYHLENGYYENNISAVNLVWSDI